MSSVSSRRTYEQLNCSSAPMYAHSVPDGTPSRTYTSGTERAGSADRRGEGGRGGKHGEFRCEWPLINNRRTSRI